MTKTPLRIRVMGKKDHHYQLKFPNIGIPVQVNEELFHRMEESEIYDIYPKSQTRISPLKS